MRIVLVVAALALGACGVSLEDYQATVEEARACSPGERCVLAGGGQCTCATPVNASKQAEIDAAAEDVRCGGARVECAAVTNPRCEQGRCVANGP